MMQKESVLFIVLTIVSTVQAQSAPEGYNVGCGKKACKADFVCSGITNTCAWPIGGSCTGVYFHCEDGSSCEAQGAVPDYSNMKCTKLGTLWSTCYEIDKCNSAGNLECIISRSRCVCKEGFIPDAAQGICTKPVAGGPAPNATLLEILNRTCIGEPAVPSYELPKGLCDPRNDSCKHEVVKLSNGEEIMCDTETDGGGWIIAKRRMKEHQNAFGTEKFEEYKHGFGDLEKNFWIGLETMHRFCPPKKPCDIRADMIAKDGTEEYIKGNVTFDGAWKNYRITLAEDEKSGYASPYYQISGQEWSPPGPVPGCGGGWWYDKECESAGLTGKLFTEYTFSEIKLRRQAEVPSNGT